MGVLDYFKSSSPKATSNTSSTSDQDVEAISTAAKGTDPSSPDNAPVRPHTDAVDDERVAFLDTFTPEEQKSIVRKIDRRLLITIGVIYLIKQIDVNNAASVKVLAVGKPTNILKQLSMTSDEYNWVQSIYYISYIIFELPSNLFLKKMTPRVFQTRICVLWGLVLACHAAVRNKEGLYAARFFLGLAEAGLFPSIMTQLCSWYRSDEMGKPIMWLFGIFNLAGILGSLLVYGISYLDGKQGMSSWQWVFLIEGVVTIAFAGLIFFIYPDYPKSPRSAKWLTPREQKFLEIRLTENAPRTQDAAFSWKEIKDTIKDVRMWSFMLAQVLMNTGGFGLSWFLPTITTNLGFAGLPRNQLLNIPPAAAGIIAIIIAAWILKKAWVPRPLLTVTIVLCEVATFAIFLGTRHRGAIYTACVLGSMFSACLAIPFWSWRTSSLSGTTGTAFALGFQSGIGQLGGVVGPQIFRSKYAAGGYKVSYGVCTGALAGCFLANCLNWYLTRNLEWDVRRVRLQRIKAEREGRLFTEDEVKFFNEREHFTKTLKKQETGDII
ncbi:retrograde regulation protein 2 [Exophiala viscosa]|uniref:Retrograde regulation protein 2 n=1 Tax=Exophiala viscosa TaxID=2486360 RepID=A0AAN6II91_9EURO|nr:retrograde regulation protein 2 [Exophiala viscosa]